MFMDRLSFMTPTLQYYSTSYAHYAMFPTTAVHSFSWVVTSNLKTPTIETRKAVRLGGDVETLYTTKRI
jgi:hypothetical protein